MDTYLNITLTALDLVNPVFGLLNPPLFLVQAFTVHLLGTIVLDVNFIKSTLPSWLMWMMMDESPKPRFITQIMDCQGTYLGNYYMNNKGWKI